MPINITGAVAQTGYGGVAVNLLKALDSLGADPAIFPIGPIDSQSFPDDIPLLERCLARARRFDADAPSLKIWHQFPTGGHYPQHGMADSIGRGKRLGMCFTELDRLKALEVHHLNSLDVVLQPSRWASQIASGSGVKAKQVVVPCAVDTSIFSADDLPAGDVTTFVLAGKFEYRKGHDVALQSFLRAFKPEDQVRLILLCENPFLTPEQTAQWHSYYKNHALGNKVEICPRFQTQREVATIFREAHCGIFPARAEGFNLEAAELLAMGRHVIMTAYAGHTEYGDAAGASMVPHGGLELADDGIWFRSQDPSWDELPYIPASFTPKPAAGRWAVIGSDQVDMFAGRMQAFHETRLEGSLGTNEAGVKFFRDWTWRAAAQRILEASK